MNIKVKIGKRYVGEGEPCFIIAEIGSNFDQNLGQAKTLIDKAVEAKVDAIKFQLFKADWLVPQNHPAYSIIKDNEFPRHWIEELFSYAEEKGVIFLATPFDTEAIDLLNTFDIAAFKWASPEIYDLPLLRHAAKKQKPIILSTGTCAVEDIKPAVDAVLKEGNQNIILLHCVSLYPAKPQHANLKMMDDLRKTFHCSVGFSDHTEGIAIPIAAVARGACIVEKHFTLSRQLKGPDHPFAVEPQELKQMVQCIREAEQGLGLSVKGHIEGMEDPRSHRKSLAAKKDIRKGSLLEENMIMCLRTSQGIDPKDFSMLLTKSPERDIQKFEVLQWSMFKS